MNIVFSKSNLVVKNGNGRLACNIYITEENLKDALKAVKFKLNYGMGVDEIILFKTEEHGNILLTERLGTISIETCRTFKTCPVFDQKDNNPKTLVERMVKQLEKIDMGDSNGNN